MKSAPSTIVPTLAACLVLGAVGEASARQLPAPPAADGIAARTAGMDSQEGFIPLHYEEESGKVMLEVSRLDEDFLYINTLAAGVGSNELGLDRGQTGTEAVVRFERHGGRILLIRQNTGHRALTEDPGLIHSVEELFPASVIASFEIDTEEEGDRYLVDATEFLLSDVYDVRL